LRPPWHFPDAGISKDEIEATLQLHREHQAQLDAWGVGGGAVDTETKLLRALCGCLWVMTFRSCCSSSTWRHFQTRRRDRPCSQGIAGDRDGGTTRTGECWMP
jgi:hypothetical protein